jgi:DNA-binding response OmpR family regulator
MQVLIIEDDKSIIDAVKVAFEFRWPDASVVAAMAGKKGIELARAKSPDIVILDLNLPDIDGFQILQKIREFSNVPVIILTVRSEDEDVLRGLEAGADDYIVKPFNYLQLLARVKAVLRRTDTTPNAGKHYNAVNARVKIDFTSQKVKVDNRPVKLTPLEYRLLAFLARNRGKVVPYNRISREIWGGDHEGKTDNIRIYIRRLRKKLRDAPPTMITNEYASGYKFEDAS